jgi:hypothetical protein
MYVSVSQSSVKEPAATFVGPIYHRQRKQAAKVYEFVIKPLFEKKNLRAMYLKLVGLVTWLMFMDGRVELVADLARKINSFMLYHKTSDSFEMISSCNTLFDLLSVRFPRETGLNHLMLASLLNYFRSIRFDAFFDVWVEQRLGFVNTLDFECMFRTLTLMGVGGMLLDLLGRLWSIMKRNLCFSVLLKVFSGYIRKEFLTLWLDHA